MQHLHRFITSEGDRYQHLQPASSDLHPRAAPEAIEDWAAKVGRQ
jgi:hypothetical protein